MPRLMTALVALALAIGVPALAQEGRPITVEDVLSLRTLSDPEISPDGAWVAYVVTTFDFEQNRSDSNLWVVAADGGSEPRPLTVHRGADDSPGWAPDSTFLTFLSDRSGSRQVHAIRPDGGEPWAVTSWPRPVEAVEVSPDGARLAFIAKSEASEIQAAFEAERGRPHVWGDAYPDEWSHLWVAPLDDGRAGAAQRVSRDGVFVSDVVWGPDALLVAFSGRPSPSLRSRADQDVYIARAEAEAEARPVSAMDGSETPVSWTRSRGLLVSATGQRLGTYNRKLWQASPVGGEPIALTESLDENAGYVAATPDVLYVEAARGTGRGLFRVGPGAELVSGPGYRHSFSATGDASRVAFLGESGDSPADVYVARTGAGFEPKALTRERETVSGLRFGEQRVVRWRSRADGEAIEGILNLPLDYREGARVPLLLVIHGGPSGVSSDRFSVRRGAYPIGVFTGMGYAVLQPNYRGSTGYGERFRGLNRGDISGRDWVDIDSGVDAMIERGIADADRLGIMGWSFGGHHTFWGITQTGRFRAASAGAGANDLVSMYSQTDLPEFYHTYLGPKPWEDFELYEERSAYRYVENVTTPLLIQVGEKDERVPAEQSIQFYEAVRAIGKAETTLVVYPGQPHGVREPRLVRDLLTRNVEWFRRLVPVSAPSTDESESPAPR